MKKNLSRSLTPCPFCRSTKVTLYHHTPVPRSVMTFGKNYLYGIKESWSFQHRCKKRDGLQTNIEISAKGFSSEAEAVAAWEARWGADTSEEMV